MSLSADQIGALVEYIRLEVKDSRDVSLTAEEARAVLTLIDKATQEDGK